MTSRPTPPVTIGPDWVVAAMPPGYRNRVAEIERLSQELEAMGQYAALLWQTGSGLSAAVRETFGALKLETTPLTVGSGSGWAVKLDAGRRLLLYVSSADEPIEKKSGELAQVFQILNEQAGSTDRVVLIANCHPRTPPADRPAVVGPDALNLLSRLGANVLPAPTLFVIWTLSLQDQARSRAAVERLHAQDGGLYQLSLPSNP